MNEMKIFDHPRFGKIRTIAKDGMMLFCEKDVVEALKYRDIYDALEHCYGEVRIRISDHAGKMQDMLFITSRDVLRLTAKSNFCGADEFKSWIFDEIIPNVLAGSCGTVRRVPNMENLGWIADIMRAVDIPLAAQNSAPEIRARQAKLIMDTYGLPCVPDYVKKGNAK